MSEPPAVLMLVSAGGRDEAERLGEGLVEAGLAACASVIPVVHSIYRWEGSLRREHEALLLVKTVPDRKEAAQAYVLEHHSYDLPEVLWLDVSGALPAYLEWMTATLAEAPAGPES